MHANAQVIQAEGIKQHMVARAPQRPSGDSEGHYLLFDSAHVQNPFLLTQIVPKIILHKRIKTPPWSHQPRAAIALDQDYISEDKQFANKPLTPDSMYLLMKV